MVSGYQNTGSKAGFPGLSPGIFTPPEAPMLYLPAILTTAICFWSHHDLTPAAVLGIVTGLVDIAYKALPGGGVWRSPSGALSIPTRPPAWSTAAAGFLRLFWLCTVAYCVHWAAQA